MLNILGLDLNSVGSFHEVSVDFNTPLTYVRGVNKDTGLQARTTGNGVGKSLLFSSIANLRYGAVPASVRKNTRKEMLRLKSSSIGMILNRGEDEYELIQKASGYAIYKNGEDLKVRGIARQQEMIRELIPIPEIAFYTREFLSTLKPYPMQMSTNEQRLQHMVELHDLDQYSDIHKHFSVKAKAIKDNELRIGVLEQTIRDHEAALEKLHAAHEKAGDVSGAEKKAKKLQEQIDDLSIRRRDLLLEVETFETLRATEQRLDELRKAYRHKTPPAELLEATRLERKSARRWAEYEAAVSATSKARKALERKLSSIELPDESLHDLKKRIGDASDRIDALSSDLKAHQKAADAFHAAREEVDELKNKLDSLGVDFEPATDYEAQISLCRAALEMKPLLEHDHEGDGRCPTCKSEVDFSKVKKAVSAAESRLPSLKKKKAAQEVSVDLKAARRALKALKYDEEAHKTCASALKKASTSLETAEEKLAARKEYDRLRASLDELEPPEKPKHEPSMSVQECDDIIEQCTEIEKQLEAKKQILRKSKTHAHKVRSLKQVEEELARIQGEVAEVESAIRSAEKEKSKLDGLLLAASEYRNNVKFYEQEIEANKQKLADFRKGSKDKKLIDILVKCYGPRGLRSVAANNVCRLLEDNLNQYRDLLFYEPFVFFVEAGDAGISIMVDRNNGSPTALTDVRNLSGAESNAFSLLYCLSDLMITPSYKKTNMLILDEPTSHMDEVTRALFNERFLPAVQDLVPNIFVITPHPDDASPNASEWIVEKNKGRSSVNILQS